MADQLKGMSLWRRRSQLLKVSRGVREWSGRRWLRNYHMSSGWMASSAVCIGGGGKHNRGTEQEQVGGKVQL